MEKEGTRRNFRRSMIICAAIKRENLICVGKNHAEIIQNYFAVHQQKIGGVQGFIDDKGNFLDRKAARIEALNCNQIIDTETFHKEDLFSEDLTLVLVIGDIEDSFKTIKGSMNECLSHKVAHLPIKSQIISQKKAKELKLI